MISGENTKRHAHERYASGDPEFAIIDCERRTKFAKVPRTSVFTYVAGFAFALCTAGSIALALAADPAVLTPDSAATATMAAANRSLGHGVSFGNALDAPKEGEWGVVVEDEWFDLAAQAGFDSVRVPIRWSAHARTTPPYTIDEAFFARVDHLIAQAQRSGLPIILDVHHYQALMDDPVRHGPRFIALWQQIAKRYADEPNTVLFELLNEPSGAFDEDPTLWNELLAETIEAIRCRNPRRPIIVGPVGNNGIALLDELALPPDPNLIVSVHFYAPMAFTHQGAAFTERTRPTGVEWWPDQTSLDNAVQDQSWNTTVRPGRKALTLDFMRRYAGFSARLPDALDPTRLRVRVRGRIELAVGCTSEGELEWVDEIVLEGGEWRVLEVALDACPVDTRRIGLMNRLHGAAELDLAEVELCDTDRCRSLLVRADDAMRKQLQQAGAWGIAHGRAMHLGEFGVHGAADLASRARWTAQVQRIASEAGLSTVYWAFGTRFGIYDRDGSGWHQPMLDALLPP